MEEATIDVTLVVIEWAMILCAVSGIGIVLYLMGSLGAAWIRERWRRR